MSLSKSDRIRDMWLKDRSLQPRQIIAALEAEGVAESANLVEVVRHRIKKTQSRRRHAVLWHVLQRDLSRHTEGIVSDCWSEWIDVSSDEVEEARTNLLQLKLRALLEKNGVEQALAELGVSLSPEIEAMAKEIDKELRSTSELSKAISGLAESLSLTMHELQAELESRGFSANQVRMNSKEITHAVISRLLAQPDLTFQQIMESLRRRGVRYDERDRSKILSTLSTRQGSGFARPGFTAEESPPNRQ